MSDPKLPDWVVEKNNRKGTGRPRVYHFDKIEVGKSLIVPAKGRKCSFRSFQVMVSAAGTKLGRKFHCRVRPVDEAFECYREK